MLFFGLPEILPATNGLYISYSSFWYHKCLTKATDEGRRGLFGFQFKGVHSTMVGGEEETAGHTVAIERNIGVQPSGLLVPFHSVQDPIPGGGATHAQGQSSGNVFTGVPRSVFPRGFSASQADSEDRASCDCPPFAMVGDGWPSFLALAVSTAEAPVLHGEPLTSSCPLRKPGRRVSNRSTASPASLVFSTLFCFLSSPASKLPRN